ncbi:hypothetical protein AB0912_20355 [Streptomyces sp. NPDC007084]|uniref:hypothetical protein n=1 Tax=Streptomyces sp. NPDC007084 TaxID=3154313 RepID=UPI0034527E9C
MAATTLGYVFLLALPYRADLADRAPALGRDLNAIGAVAALPTAIVSLFWLARRDQRLYTRLAVATLLSCATDVGVLVAVRGWSVRDESLFLGHLTPAGVPAGWYLLMALAVVASATQVWLRTAVVLIAVAAMAAAIPTAGGPWPTALPATVIPLLAWYATGRLKSRAEEPPDARAASRDAASAGSLVSLRRRSPEKTPEHSPHSVPLRQAG